MSIKGPFLLLLLLCSNLIFAATPFSSVTPTRRPKILEVCLRVISAGSRMRFDVPARLTPRLWAMQGKATIDTVSMTVTENGVTRPFTLEFIVPAPDRFDSYVAHFGEGYVGFMFTNFFPIRPDVKETPHAHMRLGLREQHYFYEGVQDGDFVGRVKSLLADRPELQTFDSMMEIDEVSEDALRRYFALRHEVEYLSTELGVKLKYDIQGTGIIEEDGTLAEDCAIYSNLSFRLPQWYPHVTGLEEAVTRMDLQLPDSVLQSQDVTDYRYFKNDFMFHPKRRGTVVWTGRTDLCAEQRLEIYRRFLKRSYISFVYSIPLNIIRISKSETFE